MKSLYIYLTSTSQEIQGIGKQVKKQREIIQLHPQHGTAGSIS